MKIAIPRLGEEIAPWFDVATHIGLYLLEKEQLRLSDVLVFPPADDQTRSRPEAGVERLRKILEAGVNLIICSGISNQYKHMAQSRGITVINHVAGPVARALQAFNHGELCGSEFEPIYQMQTHNPPLSELITRTGELFSRLGYQISTDVEKNPFPIDIIAEIKCPVCQKTVSLAICCGMHAYRADEEIRELHHAAAGAFNAEVYVNARSAEVDQACSEFGIQILDPAQFEQLLAPVTGENITLPWRFLGTPLAEHSSCQA